MSTPGRIAWTHPDLGTAGGSVLWTQINTLWGTAGDDLGGRWLSFSAVANSGVVTFTHNFGVPFSEIEARFFTGSSAPFSWLDGCSFAANGTNPTTQIDVTFPGSGGPFTGFAWIRQTTGSNPRRPARIVDPSQTANGNVYATLASAIAAAVAGDHIYVKGTETLTALVTQSVADVTIEWAPGAKTVVGSSSSQTAGLSITGARCRLLAPYIRVDNTAAVYAIKTSAADTRILDGIVETNNAGLTLTAPLQINSGGARCKAEYGILVTSGAVTNDFEDNVGTLRGSFAR